MKTTVKVALTLALGTVAIFAVPLPAANASENLGCGDIPEWTIDGIQRWHGGTTGFPPSATDQVVIPGLDDRHTSNVVGWTIDHADFLGFGRLHDSCN